MDVGKLELGWVLAPYNGVVLNQKSRVDGLSAAELKLLDRYREVRAGPRDVVEQVIGDRHIAVVKDRYQVIVGSSA